MGWLISKIKSVLLVLALVAGPALYALGAIRGRASTELEQAKDAAKTNEDVADFYRELEGLNAENTSLRGRDDLVGRLRGDGL